MFKGITPVVSIILLLLITISMVGFAFVFFSGIMTSTGEASTGTAERITRQLSTSFKIENVNKNEVVIRNIGTVTIDNDSLDFYVNNVPVSSSGPSLDKGEVGTYTLNDSQLAMLPETTELKIVGLGGYRQEEREADFYERYTVGYWKFDEGSGRDGATVSDSSGNGNVGTLTNFIVGDFNDGTLYNASVVCSGGDCPNWVDGKYGKALRFDGANDSVRVPDDVSLDITDEITIEAWINIASTAKRGMIVDKTDWASNSINAGYGVYIEDDSTLRFWWWNNNAFTLIGSALTTGVWYHVAATYNGSDAKLFVNGVLDASAPNESAMSSSYSLRIGEATKWSSTAFNGTIDEVRIYNRALTQAEIQESMNSPYPVATPVGFWSFNEGSGTTAKDTHNWVKGVSGAALSFDGVDDYVDAGNEVSLNIIDEITIEVWINPTLFSGIKRIVSRRDNYLLGIDGNGKITFYYLDGTWKSLTSNSVLTLSTWSHIAVTQEADGSNTLVRLYINGNLDKSGTLTGRPPSSSQITTIGSYGGTMQWFNGLIDEVRILNIARSMESV